MTESSVLYELTHVIELPRIYDILIELRKERKSLYTVHILKMRSLFMIRSSLNCNTFQKESILGLNLLHCINTMEL